MNCMRCGRETGPKEVFCEECRAEMAKCPVKPDAVVQIPSRNEEQPAKKQPRRRPVLTEEEQIKALTKRNRLLRVLLIVALLLSVTFACVSAKVLREMVSKSLIGRNYTTVGQTESTGPSETR